MQNRIKELRKARGLTLQQLAEQVGSSNQQISQLETGRRRLNLDWLERLSSALDCQPLELVDDGAMAKTDRERRCSNCFEGCQRNSKRHF